MPWVGSHWTLLLMVFHWSSLVCMSYVAVLWLDVVLTILGVFCAQFWRCVLGRSGRFVQAVLLWIWLHLNVAWVPVCWILLFIWGHVELLHHIHWVAFALHMPCVWWHQFAWALVCYCLGLSALCPLLFLVGVLLACTWVLEVFSCWVHGLPHLSGLASCTVIYPMR